MNTIKRLICGTIALAHLNAIAAPAKPTAVVDAEQVSCTKPFAEVDSSQLPVKVETNIERLQLTNFKHQMNIMRKKFANPNQDNAIDKALVHIESLDKEAFAGLIQALMGLEIISDSGFDHHKYSQFFGYAQGIYPASKNGNNVPEYYVNAWFDRLSHQPDEYSLKFIDSIRRLTRTREEVKLLSSSLYSLLSNIHKKHNARTPEQIINEWMITSSLLGAIGIFAASSEFAMAITYLFGAMLTIIPLTALGLSFGEGAVRDRQMRINADKLLYALAQDIDEPSLRKRIEIRRNMAEAMKTPILANEQGHIAKLTSADVEDGLIERITDNLRQSQSRVSGQNTFEAMERVIDLINLQIKQSDALLDQYKIYSQESKATNWCDDRIRCVEFNSFIIELVDQSEGKQRSKLIQEAKVLIGGLLERTSDVSTDLNSEVIRAEKLIAQLEKMLRHPDLDTEDDHAESLTSNERLRLKLKIENMRNSISAARAKIVGLDKLEKNIIYFEAAIDERLSGKHSQRSDKSLLID